MYRGTTPQCEFIVDIDTNALQDVYITFQGPCISVEKTGDDVILTEGRIVTSLTQAETLAFSDGQIEIQIRCKLKSGTAIASNIIKTMINHILKDGEI